MISALLFRDIESTLTDKGRLADMAIYPISFLVIWGLLYSAQVIPPEMASEFLVINLVWSLAGQIQLQANMGLNMDLWSREFPELMREGLSVSKYITAKVLFGTLIGCTHLLVFIASLPLFFHAGQKEILLLLITFPFYYLCAVGLSFIFGGSIILLGKSYAFITWTGLQVIVMFSSPYSPLETLPPLMKPIAYLSPLTYVFEYIRSPDLQLLGISGLQSIILAGFGLWWCQRCFEYKKRGSGLSSV